jgi:hypothetical protein
VVVRPSIPIGWFGDSSAYFDSPLRVVTLGLNPSHLEFPSAGPMIRFPAARHLLMSGPLDGPRSRAYVQALDEYFIREPYRRWFDRGFGPVLRGLDASYYPDRRSRALHTDLLSPSATRPTWSKLRQADCRRLASDGVPLWHALIEYLQPDIIVASPGRAHLERIGFDRIGELHAIHRVERRNPFITEATGLRIGQKTATLAFARCTNVPFGSVAFADREAVGKAIGIAHRRTPLQESPASTRTS